MLGLYFPVYLMPFDIDCRERACRTQILAGTASGADGCVDDRNLQCVLVFRGVILVERYHRYRTSRAVAGAVSAWYAVGCRQAVLAYPYGMTYLYGRFHVLAYLRYGSCRAEIAASCALRTAVSALVTHGRLHQFACLCGRAQDTVRARRYA